MKYWRISTDSEVNDVERTCDIWYKFQMAFTGDCEKEFKHAAVMRKLRPGHGIFMHHKGLGLVGFGIVHELWDGKSYNGEDKKFYVSQNRKEIFEYRIAVNWDTSCDCRENPVALGVRLPYRGTYCEVKSDKGWNSLAVLQELRARALGKLHK